MKQPSPRHCISLCLSTALAFALGAFNAPAAQAHPHVFIESESEVVIDKQHRITAIRHRWKFDDQYTAFALIGMDVDKDGKYSALELEPLAKENVSSLNQFDYFTFAEQEKKQLNLKDPVDYKLTYKNQELVLTFTLPLEKPIPALGNPVELAIYDPEFFIAFLEPKSKKQLRLANNTPDNCMFEKRRATMDQTAVVESRLGQAPDLTDERNKGAGAMFSPTFHISCLAATR